jgi:hypothetical protein
VHQGIRLLQRYPQPRQRLDRSLIVLEGEHGDRSLRELTLAQEAGREEGHAPELVGCTSLQLKGCIFDEETRGIGNGSLDLRLVLLLTEGLCVFGLHAQKTAATPLVPILDVCVEGRPITQVLRGRRRPLALDPLDRLDLKR